jgi:hypothetical protein
MEKLNVTAVVGCSLLKKREKFIARSFVIYRLLSALEQLSRCMLPTAWTKKEPEVLGTNFDVCFEASKKYSVTTVRLTGPFCAQFSQADYRLSLCYFSKI